MNKWLYIGITLIFVGLVSCDDSAMDPNGNGDSDDMEPPTVTMSISVDADTISGEVTLSAEASDNNEVDSVQFLIDNERISSVSTTPYEYDWQTITSVDSASHSISAKAFDSGGNSATSDEIDVVIVAPVISYSTDVQPIYDNNCALGGCHASGSGAQGLVLDANSSYDNIVNVSASQDSRDLIEPGQPDDSYLYLKITDPPSGERMPRGRPALSGVQIATILYWIEQGAQNN